MIFKKIRANTPTYQIILDFLEKSVGDLEVCEENLPVIEDNFIKLFDNWYQHQNKFIFHYSGMKIVNHQLVLNFIRIYSEIADSFQFTSPTFS